MSYAGKTVLIPFGQGGFVGEENHDVIPVTHLIQARNVRYDGNIVRKAGGFSKYDANAVTGTPNCIGGFDWWPTISLQKQITVWANGKIYKDASGDVDGVELGTGFTFTEPVVMLAAGQEYPGNNRKLIIFNKGNKPQVLNANGTAVANIAYPSTDWATTNQPGAGIIHDNRVAAWGVNSAPHSVYFSALDNHENFLYSDPADSTSYPLPIFDIAPGEGEYINACYSLGTTKLFVFKYPFGIYAIDTESITDIIAPVTTIRKDIGCAGPNAITKVGGLGTWFIGTDGHVYSLDIISDPNAEPRNACITRSARLQQWVKENVLPSRLKHSQLIYDTNRGEVWATYTKLTGTLNDIALVFDVNDPDNVKISEDYRSSSLALYNAMWISKSSTTFQDLFTAGQGGFVYKTSQSTRSVGTTGYEATFRIPSTDFSYVSPELGEVDKRFDWLELRLKATGSAAIYVDTYIDDVYYNTYTVVSGASGSPLDDSGYGLTPNSGKSDFTLGFDGYTRRKFKIGGLGRKFGIRIYNSIASADFGIVSAVVSFDLLGSGAEM